MNSILSNRIFMSKFLLHYSFAQFFYTVFFCDERINHVVVTEQEHDLMYLIKKILVKGSKFYGQLLIQSCVSIIIVVC